uniref:VWFA domain-containing protein n=1 Tax=Eptatretus burgeri TaxID=7764 RepID=A0A8C4Q5F0_EPTBU
MRALRVHLAGLVLAGLGGRHLGRPSLPPPRIEPLKGRTRRAGCRTAANELVFLLDGSWSVKPENFETVKQWLVNISSSFDIGPEYTLVSVIQYSDAPQLEISLAAHKSSERLIAAISDILYMGGNTQTGRSIQFVTKQVFPVSPRASAVLVRTVVVVTDGKSQDNVTVAALEAREKGITLFAIGVGNEVEEAELKEIANKPSSSYVFYVEDYGAISRIKEVIKQKICEETVCPTRIPSRGWDEKGFDLLEGLRVMEKAEPAEGSLQDVEAYSIGSKNRPYGKNMGNPSRRSSPFLPFRGNTAV